MPGSIRTLTAVVMIALTSWSCGSTSPDAAPKVAEIVVSPATSTLEPNAQLPLRAQVQDGSGTLVPDADVSWTVQDPKIVSVSSAGVVTALAVGTSQVAANSLGKSGIAVITVKSESVNPGTGTSGSGTSGTEDSDDEDSDDEDAGTPGAVAAVKVTAPSKRMDEGSTMQLVATATDAKGNSVPHQSFFWSSSNTSTATVSASGLVTGKGKGKVTITARTSPTGGKSGSLELDVKK
jgi:Bacterial Ig-like domain (group 2)